MTEAVAERGEHELELGGATYLLRPSHDAIVTIERRTGRSLIELMRAGNAGALTLDQLGTIACHMIRAGATDGLTAHVDAGRLSELIMEEGLHRITARITHCLVDVVTGGRKASGEAKAATAISEDAGAA